jgi:uncharacterized protein
MQIHDRVYGLFEVNEPVLIELMNSQPLQRLKRINQAGAAQYAVANKTVTRFEHSIGVMLLLRQLGANVEEQIAGLLHDIPHTAFSHVIDFVFPSHNHEFHEHFMDGIIRGSDIPAILSTHRMDLDLFLDVHHFGLLERLIPDLCADRLDYSLRDMIVGYPNDKPLHERVHQTVTALIVHDNEIVFNDAEAARNYTLDYLKIDEEKWSDPREVALFQILADALKIALDEKFLSEEDLFGDDETVMDKLKTMANPRIQNKLTMLNPRFEIRDDPHDFDFHTRNKLRYVNPKVLQPDGSNKRVTDLFPEMEKRLANHKTLIERGNFVKIVTW